MATINLTINGGISDLLQVGDQVYYANNVSFGGFSSKNTIDDVIPVSYTHLTLPTTPYV